MDKIRVAVCDDEITICHYYQNILKNTEDIEFIGCSLNVADCLSLVKQHSPDILLLDLQIDYQDAGFKVLNEVKTISPETKVIMLTMYDTESNFLSSLEQGADYFLGKTVSAEEIVSTIKKIYSTSKKYDDSMTERLLSYGTELSRKNDSLMYLITVLSTLTRSEIEILRDLCDGLSYRQISKKRFVTENTVRSQISRISYKLGQSNIKKLVKLAKDLEIFKLYRDPNN